MEPKTAAPVTTSGIPVGRPVGSVSRSESAKTSTVSIPPNPNALEMAARTRETGRPAFGTCTSASAGSGSSRPAVGTSVRRDTTSAVMAASMAPAAPSE